MKLAYKTYALLSISYPALTLENTSNLSIKFYARVKNS